MGKLIDLTGNEYGMLTVHTSNGTNRRGDAMWLCDCVCGNQVSVRGSSLRAGHTSSCGCVQRQVAKELLTTHGLSSHPLYGTWYGMKQRCNNPEAISYKYYGGRGIQVCERWMLSLPNFIQDMGEKPSPEMSIDRMNNNAGYYPENCRWATPIEQLTNRGEQS